MRKVLLLLSSVVLMGIVVLGLIRVVPHIMKSNAHHPSTVYSSSKGAQQIRVKLQNGSILRMSVVTDSLVQLRPNCSYDALVIENSYVYARSYVTINAYLDEPVDASCVATGYYFAAAAADTNNPVTQRLPVGTLTVAFMLDSTQIDHTSASEGGTGGDYIKTSTHTIPHLSCAAAKVTYTGLEPPTPFSTPSFCH